MVEVRSEHLLPLVMVAALPVDTSTEVVEPLIVITSRMLLPTTDSTLPPLIGPELTLTVVAAASAGIAAAVLRARAAPDRSTAPNVRRRASLIMRTSVCVLVK